METWMPVPAFEGSYEVSDLGQLRSLDRVVANGGSGRFVRGQIIKQRINEKSGGYMYATIAVRGAFTTRMIHRFVAAAFIGPCPEGAEVNHIDGDKTNNAVANLEYMTSAGNKQHARASGLWGNRGEQHGNSTLSEDQVRDAHRRYAGGEKLSDIARSLGTTKSAIWNYVSGVRWSHLNLPPVRKNKRRAVSV